MTFLSAPHKWNEAWADFFAKDVPVEYGARIKFLEEQLKRFS